jgi:hypothetical protein
MIREAIDDWPPDEFRIPHYIGMLGEGQLALYLGDAVRAVRAATTAWPGFVRSQLPRIQNLRINALTLRARSMLALAAGDPTHHVLAHVARDIAAVEREAMPWSDAIAALLRGGLAAVRRDDAAALRLLADAEARFAATDMAMHAATARRRRGELLGGEDGRRLVEAADREMRERGVANPERMTAMYAPGFGPRVSPARVSSERVRTRP